MRKILALLGYPILLGGGLAALVFGGLWVSSQTLGWPASMPGMGSSSSEETARKPKTVAQAEPAEETPASAQAGGEAATQPKAPADSTDSAADSAASPPAGDDQEAMRKRIEEIRSRIKPAQLRLTVLGPNGRRPRQAQLSLVPRRIDQETLDLFLQLSKQEWTSVPEGIEIPRNGEGKRPARPLSDTAPDRAVVPAGYDLQIVAWRPDGAFAEVMLPQLEAGEVRDYELKLVPPGGVAEAESEPAAQRPGRVRPDRFLRVLDPSGEPADQARALSDRRLASGLPGGLLRLQMRNESSGWVLVGAPGFGTLTLRDEQLGQRPDEPWEIQLPAAASLALKVTSEGDPMVGMRVRVLMLPEDWDFGEEPTPVLPLNEGRSMESELLELGDLPAGHALCLEVVQGRQLVHRIENILLEAEERRELDVELPSEGILQGRVVDAAGEPVAESEIWILPAEGDPRRARYFEVGERPLRRAATGIEGNFRLAALEPGRWWIGLAPPELDEERNALIEDTAWAPLARAYQLEPDTSELEILAVPALLMGGTVILSARGDEPESPGVGITVLATSIEYGSTLRTLVGPSGRFTFQGLAPGHFDLSLADPPKGSTVRIEGGTWVAAGMEGTRIYVALPEEE